MIIIIGNSHLICPLILFSFLAANSLTTADNNNDTDDTDTEKNASPILADDDHDEIDKKQFERHKFPRDSGCFASSSSPASDRSSQPSQSESGIQPDDDIGGLGAFH